MISSSSFNYPLMDILCRELQKRLANFKVVDCLPHDLKRFFLIFSRQNQQEALFFCFTPPFLRFHLAHPFAPARLSSSHPLQAFLQEAILKKANVLQQDRILQLTFDTAQGERLLIAEFFSKHPNYYLIQADRKILFALQPYPHSHYRLPAPSLFHSPTPPLWSCHQEVAQAYAELEKQQNFLQTKRILQTPLITQAKKLKRKEQEVIHSLKQCVQWPEMQHEGELIKFHLASLKKGLSSLLVQDWESTQPYLLKLDPTLSPQESMAACFRRAKKLQAGIQPLTQYLTQIQEKLREITQRQQILETLQTLEELTAFKHQLPASIIPSSSPPSPVAKTIYREYQSGKGLKIWVGKNAKANDRLTFQLANGRDWWLHVQGYSGSHVIIRLMKTQEPDSETLKDAMQLALYHSKARAQGEGEICFTQRKYVSRLGKGKTGLVQISKHQKTWIRFDPVRFRALQERSNLRL